MPSPDARPVSVASSHAENAPASISSASTSAVCRVPAAPTVRLVTRRLLDLSHIVRDGLVTYPGLPAPRIPDHLSRAASRERYAPGYEFQIGRIDMVANTGTYLDTPFHRFADGHDLAD